MTRAMQASGFVLDILDQNERFLLALPDGAYDTRVEVIGGTMGGHLRHSLEHLRGLLEGAETGEVFFERRRRDALIAGMAGAGLDELRGLRDALQAAADADADGFLARPLTARSSLSGALDENVAYASCVGRELIYVGLHFTHHMALMAAAARALGLPVDPDFGKAPATRVYERRMTA